MENINEYFIRSFHTVYEDSYKDGILANFNSYEMQNKINAKNPFEAIEIYCSKILGYEIDSENLEIDEDLNILGLDILVDENNLLASIEQVEKWKNDKYRLFTDSISFKIYEFMKISNLCSVSQ